MGSFLLIIIAAILVASIVFGAAAFTIGRDRGLTPPRPDGVPFDLPPDRPLDRADVAELRFDTTVRGYRMSQVDLLFERVADDLDFLYARIADLEDQLAARVDEDPEGVLELPSWVEPGPVEPTVVVDPAEAVAGNGAEPAVGNGAEPAVAVVPGSAVLAAQAEAATAARASWPGGGGG